MDWVEGSGQYNGAWWWRHVVDHNRLLCVWVPHDTPHVAWALAASVRSAVCHCFKWCVAVAVAVTISPCDGQHTRARCHGGGANGRQCICQRLQHNAVWYSVSMKKGGLVYPLRLLTCWQWRPLAHGCACHPLPCCSCMCRCSSMWWMRHAPGEAHAWVCRWRVPRCMRCQGWRLGQRH